MTDSAADTASMEVDDTSQGGSSSEVKAADASAPVALLYQSTSASQPAATASSAQPSALLSAQQIPRQIFIRETGTNVHPCRKVFTRIIYMDGSISSTCHEPNCPDRSRKWHPSEVQGVKEVVNAADDVDRRYQAERKLVKYATGWEKKHSRDRHAIPDLANAMLQPPPTGAAVLPPSVSPAVAAADSGAVQLAGSTPTAPAAPLATEGAAPSQLPLEAPPAPSPAPSPDAQVRLQSTRRVHGVCMWSNQHE